MDYIVTKKKIKNYIIRIYPDKTIKVSVPSNATKEQIQNFIDNKKDWIEKTLKKFDRKIEEENDKNIVKIFGENRVKKIIKSEVNMIRLSKKSIYVYSNFDFNDKEKIDNLLEEWKINELSKVLRLYLDKYLKILNTSIKGYKIKMMKSAWGIYHIRKNYISFNKLLVEKDYECIEYVVLHEICHIFHPHHQKQFWDLVQKYMYNYKEYRKKLKH